MANLLDTSAQFVAGNAMDIILVVLLLFLLTVYIITNNITFPKSHPRLKEIVVMETFDAAPPAVGAEALCSSTIGNSSKRNEGCKALSESQCELAHCCVWAKPKGAKADKLKTECLAGNKFGPTYDKHFYGDFYWKGKKHLGEN